MTRFNTTSRLITDLLSKLPWRSSDRSDPRCLDCGAQKGVCAHRRFSQKQLKKLCNEWKRRLHKLMLRERELEFARSLGMNYSWAGKTSDITLVRRSLIEAEFIFLQLHQALKWCQAQKILQQVLLLEYNPVCSPPPEALTGPTAYPPALKDLPYPLPEVPRSSRDYKAVVEAPPKFKSRESMVGPPRYSLAILGRE
ncbi:BZ3500_MvSof-1268-A1-R1_Chr8-2g10138 [Microbotryum saponariae]|uniref:BZ3500_MvSof-1268-A1-R1_Chr8-2g10138 protein n=1 Tax=Microbotryum saponariae TaxID=289078 RepID=A0A2X0L8B9_9BASI|nr:BZ3500_MvSof-1268-A1-R1_Chr8-2g10138 [Microbotryum saponariae]SDA01859.1 BZ3501_MvSof-1269-A2-R1_Chr8-2g09889 [Microbotryum saponariae]